MSNSDLRVTAKVIMDFSVNCAIVLELLVTYKCCLIIFLKLFHDSDDSKSIWLHKTDCTLEMYSQNGRASPGLLLAPFAAS